MKTIPIVTRRELLGTGLGLIGVGSMLPNFLVRTALAGPNAQEGQRVLVVLQLHGGNDALSTLVPYGHKMYYEVRGRETAIGEAEVLKLNDEVGLHPRMTGSKRMWDEGELAVIHGVGMPYNNYSHFTSTRIWQAADRRGPNAPTGWIGRAMDVAYPDSRDPELMLGVGTGRNVYALSGERHQGLSFNSPSQFAYQGSQGDEARAALYRKLNEMDAERDAGYLNWVSATAIRANAASESIRQKAAQYSPKVSYPNSSLGRYLQTIAGLIVGGLSTRVYWTRADGFDTHLNQRSRHDSLWQNVDGSLTAFFDDLKAHQQAHRVLVMYYSEFSRTTKQNGRAGTDHAHAGAQFLWGPGVKRGIFGEHPSLKAEDGLRGHMALRHTTDYRCLYRTVLERWLQIPSDNVLELDDNGEKFPLIDCIA